MPKSTCRATRSRKLYSFWTSLVFLATFFATDARATPHDWIFLDFGETVVTGSPATGYRYLPDVQDYLERLREKGYKIGLITNIPESWGEHCEAKLAALKAHVERYFIDTSSFDWTLFDRIVLAPFDRYRKPHPYMFFQGLELACPGRAMYIGDDWQETRVADRLGFATHFGAAGSGDRPSLDHISRLLESGFHFVQPDSCDLTSHIGSVLIGGDDATNVAACNLAPHD